MRTGVRGADRVRQGTNRARPVVMLDFRHFRSAAPLARSGTKSIEK